MSPKWVCQTRQCFLTFLHAPHFPAVERYGQREKTFDDPERVIRLIGALAVTCDQSTDLGLHGMT